MSDCPGLNQFQLNLHEGIVIPALSDTCTLISFEQCRPYLRSLTVYDKININLVFNSFRHIGSTMQMDGFHAVIAT